MKTCGTCNLCCKVVAVEILDKPADKWCQHAMPGKGCSIYGSHPAQCAGFKCFWLEDPDLSDEWKPNRCKFVVRADGVPGTMIIDVDASYPTSWKKEPYYQQIKSWSRVAWDASGRVLVYLGRSAIAVFPEEEISIGIYDPGDDLVSGYRKGNGWRQPFTRLTRGGQTSEKLGKVYPY